MNTNKIKVTSYCNLSFIVRMRLIFLFMHFHYSCNPAIHPPVFASLLLEEFIKLQHLLPGDDVDLELGQHLVHQPQIVVHQALPVTPHVVAGAPEDEHRILAGIQQLVATAQDPLHAGVSDDTQGGAAADIVGVTPGSGSIVHADDALGPIDLFTPAASDEVT